MMTYETAPANVRKAFDFALHRVMLQHFASEPTEPTPVRAQLAQRIAAQAERSATSKYRNQDDLSVLYMIASLLWQELASNPGAISPQEAIDVWREAERHA